MSAFLKNAAEIFAVAQTTAGGEDCEWSILVGRDGGVHMVADGDWPLDRLRVERGAESAYRVRRAGGRVQVEARRAGESCLLAREASAGITATARAPLPLDFPRYLMIA